MEAAEWAAIGAVGSAVGGIAAAALVLWNGRETRRHNRMSVRPVLAGEWTHHDDGSFRFELRNVGLGPAFITSASIEHANGSRFPLQTLRELARLDQEMTKFAQRAEGSTLTPHRKILHGENVEVLAIWHPTYAKTVDPTAYSELRPSVILRPYALKVGYKSIYDEAMPQLVSDLGSG